MPSVCPKCCIRINDKTDNSIKCDVCNKWHHLKCSYLTKDQFDIHTVEDSLEWFCNVCTADKCEKCDIVFRKGKSIVKCSSCTKKYHISCVGLSKQSIVKIDTKLWNCTRCKNDIFPFNTITSSQIESFSFNSLATAKHTNKLRTINFQPSVKTNNEIIPTCSICRKAVVNTNKSIPCPTCNHFIHKKCCQLKQDEINDLKRSYNVWECTASK